MSEHHETIEALLSDLRADRAELNMLRQFYRGAMKAMNAAKPLYPPRLEYNVQQPMAVLRRIADALPDRRKYLALLNAERRIRL